MTQDIAQAPDYREFIRSLKDEVQSAQIKAARSVNTQLIGLYWELGKRIRHTVKPFVVGTVAQAQCAVAVVPERGEPQLKGYRRAQGERATWSPVSHPEHGDTPKATSCGVGRCGHRTNCTRPHA